VGGQEKVANLHGSIECVNPRCEAFQCVYTRARDTNSAVAIAIAGASVHFHPHCIYSQETTPTMNPSHRAGSHNMLLSPMMMPQEPPLGRREYTYTAFRDFEEWYIQGRSTWDPDYIMDHRCRLKQEARQKERWIQAKLSDNDVERNERSYQQHPGRPDYGIQGTRLRRPEYNSVRRFPSPTSIMEDE
jgi:hypothetical protein